NGTEICEEQDVRGSPKPVCWAEEVKQADFQSMLGIYGEVTMEREIASFDTGSKWITPKRRALRQNKANMSKEAPKMGQVEEFQSPGSFFTWTNKHEVGDRIFSKLDRVFINNIWLNDFPNSDAYFKWEVISDHCLCLIQNREHNNIGVKPFRFGNHWPSYPGYAQTVMECWNKTVAGFGLESLVQSLFRVKHALKNFNRHEVGEVAMDYRNAKEMYCNIQEEAAMNPTPATFSL
uniref:Uncharacterized protein n=1 Tax=Cannabis sativa TaxID=3483 RepID=A0A803QJB1_CANSA